jgi:hypothetical protein
MKRIGPTATILLGMSLLIAPGCRGPSQANIELRKENQNLSTTIGQLQRRHEADLATISALQNKSGTVPMLPEDRLAELFTTSGIRLAKSTGGFHDDPNAAADTMIKVFVVPIDQEGDPLKAAGSFHIELFDLSLPKDNRIGMWDFDNKAARQLWYAQLMFYTYILKCPLQTTPAHANLLLRVTFVDDLTQRSFTVDRDLTLQRAAGAVASQ